MRYGRFALTALVPACLMFGATAPKATAQALWYNGDFDGRSGLANEINTIVNNSQVYDDFIVPVGQTWNVTDVFSNDQMTTNATTATWEIRTGVSAGNGGTLVGSGTESATITPTGRMPFGVPEYTVDVAAALTLGPGTYWLNVTPIGDGTGRSFVSTTSGANSVGIPAGDDGNSFWNSTFFAESFAPTTTTTSGGLGPGTWDFSMGVDGSLPSSSGTPEPGSVALLLGMSVAGAGVFARRKRALHRK